MTGQTEGLPEHAPSEAVRALFIAFYCLHDTLVAKGVLPDGEVAQNLRQLHAPVPELMAHIYGIAAALEQKPFAQVYEPRLKLVVTDEPGSDQTV